MSEVPFGIEPLIVQTQAVMDGGKAGAVHAVVSA